VKSVTKHPSRKAKSPKPLPARHAGRSTAVSAPAAKRHVKVAAPPPPPAAKSVPTKTIKTKAVKELPIASNERPVPLTSVPTDGKPRKNQAGLTSRELESFRALLLDKRRQLVGDVSSMERDALHAGGGTNLSNLPLHMADMGTDNYEQEFTIGLMEKDRKLLKEINRALAKIQDGSYGICEGTGQPISKVRLEAQPWARYSIEHARKLEHGGVGRINPD
jgi:DnaK suppressor protein